MKKLDEMKRAMYIGFAATIVMTIFYYLARQAHVPHHDVFGMVGGDANSLGAWVTYFGIGMVLSYVYHAHVEKRLPSHSWIRGAVYGAVLFAFIQGVLMPAFGMGFFAGTVSATVGMLFGLASYGATVGYFYSKA